MPTVVIDGLHAIRVDAPIGDVEAQIVECRKRFSEGGSPFARFVRMDEEYLRLEVRVDANRVTHINATDEDATDEGISWE